MTRSNLDIQIDFLVHAIQSNTQNYFKWIHKSDNGTYIYIIGVKLSNNTLTYMIEKRDSKQNKSIGFIRNISVVKEGVKYQNPSRVVIPNSVHVFIYRVHKVICNRLGVNM